MPIHFTLLILAALLLVTSAAPAQVLKPGVPVEYKDGRSKNGLR